MQCNGSLHISWRTMSKQFIQRQQNHFERATFEILPSRQVSGRIYYVNAFNFTAKGSYKLTIIMTIK